MKLFRNLEVKDVITPVVLLVLSVAAFFIFKEPASSPNVGSHIQGPSQSVETAAII